jgi:adenosylcobinamide-phosphate synthase
MSFHPALILPAAFLLDIILGDPRRLPHPVRWMGKLIETAEPFFRRLRIDPVLSGACFTLSLVAGVWTTAYAAVAAAGTIHPAFRTILEIILIYYSISVRCLDASAMEVAGALKQNRLEDARKLVSMIVGRDTEGLGEKDVSRAAVETVAENLVDGIISPLFYAAIGGAPLALAFKMVNTLDSMVGYRNEKYMRFGKASARLDDLVNIMPARLSVPVVSLAAHLLARRGKEAFGTAWAEGADHTSPNAGYPEAAFAGALKVRLNGPNRYGGVLVEKPYVGKNFGDTLPSDIRRACDLMILSSLIWLTALTLIRLLHI